MFQSLFEGVVLTAIVLMPFLHAWRNAVVVMIAIPRSLRVCSSLVLTLFLVPIAYTAYHSYLEHRAGRRASREARVAPHPAQIPAGSMGG